MEATAKGVFFDLDDTLIVYEPAVREALRRTEARFAPRCPLLADGALGRAVWEAYARRFGYGTDGYPRLALLTVPELRRELTRAAFQRLGIDAPSLEAEVSAFYCEIEARLIRARDDARQTLDALRGAVRLGVITNGPSALQRQKLHDTGLAPLLETIVVDTEEGWPKPDARIFARAAERVGIDPGELVFVGNSPDDDVAGARAAGWVSVWFGDDGPAPPDAHFTVARLSDLTALPPVARAIRGRAPGR